MRRVVGWWLLLGAHTAWAAEPVGKPTRPAKAAKPQAGKIEAGKTEPGPIEDGQTPVGEDALRLGPFSPPPRPFPFPLLGDERAHELFVDYAGKLYKERPYSGQVPDWNAVPPSVVVGRCKVAPQTLSWVGFQNNDESSRIYVQLEKAACGYVYRADDNHLVIDLPQVTVPNASLKREILTGAFPTPVVQIKTDELQGRGTRVVIALRDKRPYLSAHLGRYLFVDVQRDAHPNLMPQSKPQ
jgi:hypothetical protein